MEPAIEPERNRIFGIPGTLIFFIILPWILVLASGCAGLRGVIGTGDEAVESEAASELAMVGRVEEEEKPELPPFRNQYIREDFIRALVQLDEIRESTEYFDQYMWGDQLFEDSLASITWLAGEPVSPGQGVLLVMYDDRGGEYLRIKKGWIEDQPGGDGWWKMEVKSRGENFACEVKVDAKGVPQMIRVKDLDSGEKLERTTFYAQMPEGEGGDGEWFQNIRREEYLAGITPLYAGMEITGEEVIMAGGRWLRAVRMESAPVPNGAVLEAWFSPDVSGKVLRIALREGRVIAELTGFSEIGKKLNAASIR